MLPILYFNIQPFGRHNLSEEASLDKDGSESVLEVTNKQNDEDSETASFTDEKVPFFITVFPFSIEGHAL